MVTARTVWLVMEDEDVAQRLVEISRKHCKLALEFGSKNTQQERREAIKNEIEQLRMERASILNA